jgi:hypothetical protein
VWKSLGIERRTSSEHFFYGERVERDAGENLPSGLSAFIFNCRGRAEMSNRREGEMSLLPHSFVAPDQCGSGEIADAVEECEQSTLRGVQSAGLSADLIHLVSASKQELTTDGPVVAQSVVRKRSASGWYIALILLTLIPSLFWLFDHPGGPVIVQLFPHTRGYFARPYHGPRFRGRPLHGQHHHQKAHLRGDSPGRS